MKDLRLLQIVPSLESGGVEQGTLNVANFIADKGHQSFIASKGGRMLKELNHKKVQHIELPIHSKNPLVMINNINRIKKIIKYNQINLVHVRSRAPAWSAYFACKNLCKMVSTFHNVYGNENFLKRFYNRRLSKVEKIVAISEYVKNSIIDIYGIKREKIVVIYRGVDTEFYDPNLYNETAYLKFYSKFHIPDDKKIILYPGRLTSWKGQIDFLDIIESLDANKHICYFIGDIKNKSYFKKFENKINKRNLGSVCKIFGNISKEEMRLMYKSADVIVSAPLKPEGFGRVISEGLAMKKIVLSYNYGGAKEQISELDDLFSVTPNNKQELISKINIALELENDKKNMIGEFSRNLIKRKFSNKNMLDNYLQFYHKIIQ